MIKLEWLLYKDNSCSVYESNMGPWPWESSLTRIKTIVTPSFYKCRIHHGSTNKIDPKTYSYIQYIDSIIYNITVSELYIDYPRTNQKKLNEKHLFSSSTKAFHRLPIFTYQLSQSLECTTTWPFLIHSKSTKSNSIILKFILFTSSKTKEK